MEVSGAPQAAKVPDTVASIHYQCDACLMGNMIPTGNVFTTDPPKYEHACEVCGVHKGLDRTYPYSKITYKDVETLASAQHQRQLLATALGEVLVAAGMVRADAPMTGPELLMAADTFVNPGVDQFAGQKLQVGAKVARDDGRFYVPVLRCAFRYADARSLTVLRVASDAFDTVEQAEEFAEGVVQAWNSARRIKD